MFKLLSEAALSPLVVPEGADPATRRTIQRRRRRVETQLLLARRAITVLQSVRTDIEALRIEGGDYFEGTGDWEFGHEGVGVKMDWPNLAIDSDEMEVLLKEVANSDEPNLWFVFHGDCQTPLRCEADERDEAMQICAEIHPGSHVHCVVPATCHGELVMEGYGEDMVRCPKCGSRTDFSELPRDGWQVHVCLRCRHSFIAVPDENEKQRSQVLAAEGVQEVIADIAFTAGHLHGSGKLADFSDSREMMAQIIDWAHAFESVFDKDRHGDNYMELIDDYAAQRLLGEHDKAVQMLKSMHVKREATA